MPLTKRASREITFGQAINEALAEEMRRDPKVFILGEDVAEAGTPFKVLSGLVKEFGKERVIDSPISEAAITGLCVGAAMTGMRPVVDIMFGDFVTLTMDQMVNQAAKIHYMSGGKLKVPMVMRTTLGAVVFFEDKMMYQLKGPVPEGEYTIPLGVADIKRVGTDITIVATSSMVQVALSAAETLEKSGISAEVVDVRTTVPLDKQTIIESAKKTSRAIVVDEGYERYGVTAEIASVIADGAFYHLDAPVKRMGAKDVPVPFSPVLEDQTVPSPESVAEMAKTLCRKS